MRLIKLLAVSALCAILTGCVPVAIAPAPLPESSPGHQPSTAVTQSPSDLPAPPPSHGPAVTYAAYADEVDTSSFSQLYRLTDPVGNAYPGEFDVVVWCEEEMLAFTVSTVEYDGEQFTIAASLNPIASVAPGEAVAFAAWIPESIPGTMVSFQTTGGGQIDLLLAWSGLDGSVHLIELG